MNRMAIMLFLSASLALARTAAAQAPPEVQPWGTWIWSMQVAPGRALPTIVTLHKEGTANSTPGNLFSLQPYVFSPLHDVWERTGPDRVGTTCLQFVFDANTRMLLGFGRARNDARLVDVDHLEGTMYYDFLPCPTPSTCPDPTNPNAQWQPWPAFPLTGRAFNATRLKRVEPGPLRQLTGGAAGRR